MTGSTTIPKITHQTWKTNHLPRHIDRCVDSIRKINDNWGHFFYTDLTMEAVIKELSHSPRPFDRPTLDEFRSIPSGVEKSDVFRCAALYLRGGIYCDVDIEAIQPFDTLLGAAESLGLLDTAEVLLTTDHPLHCQWIYGRDLLMNHFIAAKPNAQLFEAYFNKISPLIRSGNLGGDPISSTGPIFLTNLVDQIGGLDSARVSIMPSEWINPLPDMSRGFPDTARYDEMIRDRSWKTALMPFAAHYWWHNYCGSGSNSTFRIYGDLIFATERSNAELADYLLSPEREIWRLLTPSHHHSLKRYGPNSDGGYVVAEDLIALSTTVYSYGVGSMPNESQFEFEMALLGKSVYLYDGTITSPAHHHANFKFKCENAQPGNLINHLIENNHQGRGDLLLKMDIEGDEYKVLLGCEDHVFDHFSQIILEVHSLHECLDALDRGWGTPQIILLLRKLLGRYRLVHIHGNNHGAFRCELPDVAELLFVRKDVVAAPDLISGSPCPRQGLDFPNNISRPDLQLDWWSQLAGQESLGRNGTCFGHALRGGTSLKEIPAIIHQSWKDADIPNDSYPRDWQESWRVMHPDWEYRFWTDSDNRELVRRHYPQYLRFYDALDMGIKRADFCRFLYLHRYGGLYVDLDFIALRNQRALFDNASIVVGSLSLSNPHYRIPNAYMASVAGEPFWLQLADDAVAAAPHEQSVERLSGPFRLQWGLEKYKPDRLRILEQAQIYPFDWINFTKWDEGRHYREDLVNLARELRELNIQDIRERLPNSYAVTTWNHNW